MMLLRSVTLNRRSNYDYRSHILSATNNLLPLAGSLALAIG